MHTSATCGRGTLASHRLKEAHFGRPRKDTTDVKNGLRFVDSDGHVYEHPANMIPELAAHAPKQWVDQSLDNWGAREMSRDGPEEPAAAEPTEQTDNSVMSRLLDPHAEGGWASSGGMRLKDMDSEGIDVSVLYPTSFLGIQHEPDLKLAEVQCRAYNDWLSDHVADSDGGCGAIPQQDLELAAKELRRASKLPGIKPRSTR